MKTNAGGAALVVLLLLSVACGSSGHASPTAPSPSPTHVSPPQPATDFPPLSGPSRTFIFDRELSYRVSDYTKQSRFVLYENGAFVLQYAGLNGAYRGGYHTDNGAIVFEWEGWSAAGPWGATGAVNGDSLTVRYNLIMQLTDFEDAVYVRTP